MTQESLLRKCRYVISELLEKAWEIGGYTVGEDEFEGYDFVKNGRYILDKLDIEINNLMNQKPLQ